jgi:hypothetical protein
MIVMSTAALMPWRTMHPAQDLPRTLFHRIGGKIHRREAVFISESLACRILKEADLITAPAHVVIKAADAFKGKTTAINPSKRFLPPAFRLSS